MIEIPTTLTTTQSQSQMSLQPAALHPATASGAWRAVTIVAQNSKPKFRALSARHRVTHTRDSLNHRLRPDNSRRACNDRRVWQTCDRSLRFSRLLTSLSRARNREFSPLIFVTLDKARNAPGSSKRCISNAERWQVLPSKLKWKFVILY